MKKERTIELIADHLERQVADSSILDSTIWNLLKLSKGTFYRLKPRAVEEMDRRLAIRQKELEATRTQETIKAAKSGLKSKTERVLILQKQIDISLKELEEGSKEKEEGEEVKSLTLFEKVALRRCIRELQAEISKIEGDYSPEKKAITDSNGKDIDYSKLPTTVLNALIKASE